MKVNGIKPDQGHLDIDKIEHFIDLRNTPADFFDKIIQTDKKNGRLLIIDREKPHIKDTNQALDSEKCLTARSMCFNELTISWVS